MRRVADKARRQEAQLRELASLGVHRKLAAQMLGIHDAWALQLERRGAFVFPPKPKLQTEFARAVRDGYALNKPPSLIASELGTSVASVRVTACQLGVTSGRNDPAVHRRGFAVPDHLRGKYRELRALGLTTDECGYELGLIKRPKVAA